MACIICKGNKKLPDDVSTIEKQGTKSIFQGKIYAVIRPDEAHYSPFANYCTVSLYPRKGRVKYLKFATPKELNKWAFAPGMRIRCEGCLHIADGYELVFDVKKVELI